MKSSYLLLTAIFTIVCISSCGNENAVAVPDEVLIYNEPGLVDSAAITSCYDYTRSHFLKDTFSIWGYNKLKVEFESFTTSDRAMISFVEFSNSVNNRILYAKSNNDINSTHSFEINVPAEPTWYELRLFLSPRVCGENEFKFIRARDLKIYGIK